MCLAHRGPKNNKKNPNILFVFPPDKLEMDCVLGSFGKTDLATPQIQARGERNRKLGAVTPKARGRPAGSEVSGPGMRRVGEEKAGPEPGV